MIGSHCPGYQFDSGFVERFGGPKEIQKEAPELFRDSFWFTCGKQRICTTLLRFWQVLHVQEGLKRGFGGVWGMNLGNLCKATDWQRQ